MYRQNEQYFPPLTTTFLPFIPHHDYWMTTERYSKMHVILFLTTRTILLLA